MRRFAFVVLPALTLALACQGPKSDGTDADSGGSDGTGEDGTGSDGTVDDTDSDGDGIPDREDCEPDNAEVFPGADELCNGIDDNCDGEVDTDALHWPDEDQDGHGDAAADSVLADCDQPPEGLVSNAHDCDDRNPEISPDAQEVCDDLDTDEDCDGLINSEDDSVTGGMLYGVDADADGFGSDDDLVEACEEGAGLSEQLGDCNDADDSIYPGAPEGLLDLDRNCDGTGGGSLGGADVHLVGEESGDLFGLAVSFVGDLDGDGLGEVIVGAEYNDRSGSDGGAAYLFLGSSLAAGGTLDGASADAIFVAETSSSWAGFDVAGVGDVDGDGKGDLLIAATGDAEGGFIAGAAYLVYGRSIGSGGIIDLADADVKFVGESAYGAAGHSLARAGDYDGDGLDDVLIGADKAANYAGRTYLFYAASLGSETRFDLSEADHIFTGEVSGDRAPRDLASAGDVDGDGKDDLLIGAWRNDSQAEDSGRAYLFFGGNLGASGSHSLADADVIIDGTAQREQVGSGVAGVGDVDGDGTDDVLVAAYGTSPAGTFSGSVHLFLGSSLGSSGTYTIGDADVVLNGIEAAAPIGRTLAGPADLDGDGLFDLVISGETIDTADADAGGVYIFRGSSLAAETSLDMNDADIALTGTHAYDYAGWGLDLAGDVDGDGSTDLIVGACFADDGGANSGKAYVLFNGL